MPRKKPEDLEQKAPPVSKPDAEVVVPAASEGVSKKVKLEIGRAHV